MKIKRHILIVIKKAKLSQLFSPLLAVFCLIVLALVYIFYNPKPQTIETSSSPPPM
ncbi:hypothetical protein [Caldicellulosiruptor morganii]|uniref:Uncharacterized protein n=1 Tax=Caldicellulosiruptor morganii TaxID=1387555 RepID=A0ABY7BQD7_9FIRM|nr:hypothetical protein [Caldicellulosiruptor morganii]WAM34112.1 hypothetical protein OTK00_000277 [Caldicellulosiruptor morganii]